MPWHSRLRKLHAMATASASQYTAGNLYCQGAKCAVHVMQDNASCRTHVNVAEAGQAHRAVTVLLNMS